ncbi:replication protein A2 [Brevipalpus obovatus]|uniref:replication protein A2 n=1 Tax=Brevipalpus obovatus TaxID=246614 RepID=UPI003D9E513E
MSEGKAKRLVPINLDIIEKLSKTQLGVVIHKQRFDQITFVGRVRSINDQNTKCSYLVDDYTSAPREVIQWKGGEERASSATASIKEGDYVRVNGQVRYQNDNISLITFKISPIKDYNDVILHSLEVAHNCLLLRKIKLAHYAHSGDISFDAVPMSMSMGTSERKSGDAGQKTTRDHILAVLRNNPNDTGLDIEFIAANLPSRMPMDKLRPIMDELVNEGHLFNTMDDDHYKSAYD